ncbi:bromodomain-containing protein DDB G0270170-like [Aphis craccivora]|uniref:Bromodomain-containing protein DDB G0270170-like n=1 Tax=Aphis craccivora TaxID=307492 RepID=A0A6G0X9Y2_APHCR|nr:bromodomain-containing protein DDB G0270170-like [Aphis craccivora]
MSTMVRENKCCIKNCPGLHKSRFSIPERYFNEWQQAIGTPLTKRSRIFLKKPRLKDGAIPKLLLNGNTGNNIDTPITLDTAKIILITI